jgi:hypothetical protein
MKKYLLIILTVLTAGLFSGCDYYRDNFQYSSIAKEYMDNAMHQRYDKCLALTESGSGHISKARLDTLKTGIDFFRNDIVKDFGENLDYSFLQVVKGRTSTMADIPNTTTVMLQFSNDKSLGVVQVLFSTKTDKILNIRSLGVNQPIPDMSTFWLFGVVAICIPIFNIYMLVRVKRSNMTKKWIKYLAIIFLNFPAIGYAQIAGFFIKFDTLRQAVLGFGFIKMGYPGSLFLLGIPLGALYIFWQLKTGKYEKAAKPVAPANQIKGKRFKAG